MVGGQETGRGNCPRTPVEMTGKLSRCLRERLTPKPEFTEAMGRGVDTRDDGQGKANGPGPIPIDGDEGGVRLAHSYDDGGPHWRCWAKLSG